MRRYAGLSLGLLLLGFLVKLVFEVGANWETSDLKAMLVPIATLYLNIFSHPLTGLGLSAGMILGGIAAVTWLQVWRFGPVFAALGELTEALRQIAAQSDNFNVIQALDETMENAALFREEWRTFRHALLPSDQGDGKLQALTRPEVFFNMRRLQIHGVDIALLRSLPAYFVGFGLMFTFMGLIAGLYFASRGLMAADMTTARLMLVQLLHTSTFKFSTSVAGLGSSLAVSIYARILVSRLEQKMDGFCQAVERLAPPAFTPIGAQMKPHFTSSLSSPRPAAQGRH